MAIFDRFRKTPKSLSQIQEGIRTLERRQKEKETFDMNQKLYRELRAKESSQTFAGKASAKIGGASARIGKATLSGAKTAAKKISANQRGNDALKLSSNPFQSSPSQNAFSSPTRPDYGVKNVIYGEPKKESKPKKRRITLSFDE